MMKPEDVAASGTPVWYHPVRGRAPRFAALTSGPPGQLGGGQWVVRLFGLGLDYLAWSKRESTKIAAAALDNLEPRTAGEADRAS